MTSSLSPGTRFFVVSSIALSFVSFWRASAIVLCDLGSSAYYVGGIAEKAIGPAAAWFVLGVMLFSYAVRAVYIESCSMFVRGGVYRVVREAMGGTAAKLSVSALMFDYVLTGPISGVSAGLYLAALLNEMGDHFHVAWMKVPSPLFAAGFAFVVTLYFWYTNRVGVPFSSTKALRIMQITTVMVVLLISWCILTICLHGWQPVPAPIPANLHFSDDALGWLKGTAVPGIALFGILIGVGHSVLALSGEETLAQVNREIAAPKLPNLKRTGFIIFVYSLLFTSLVSFFAKMIIPDADRSKYFDNLIGGLSMYLVGPFGLKLAFHAFVVLVGVLILAGAVNTAIIGSNGVLNRVAEDGVLPAWFRHPHEQHGTTHRLINMIVALQLITIVISHGDVYMLGEAYAFGVIWSFAMKALAVMVLRYKRPGERGFKVPFNFSLRGTEIPVGLFLITAGLFAIAGINLFTKKVATISGVAFTIVIYTAFTLSERHNKKANPDAKKSKGEEDEMEHFRVDERQNVSAFTVPVQPGNTLVAIKDLERMQHVTLALQELDPEKSELVALCVPEEDVIDRSKGMRKIAEADAELFSKVVHLAEREGKPVKLLAVSSRHPLEVILQTAHKLRSSRVMVSCSEGKKPADQERAIVYAWERLAAPRPTLSVEIVPTGDEQPWLAELGPHLTRLSAADEERAHRLWSELAPDNDGFRPHHSDILSLAIRRLERELQGSESADLKAELQELVEFQQSLKGVSYFEERKSDESVRT